MLIAAIRSGGALAGKAVSYSEGDGKFWLTGVGEVTPARLIEYDAAGEVEWADEATRGWVAMLAQGTAAPPPTSAAVKAPGAPAAPGSDTKAAAPGDATIANAPVAAGSTGPSAPRASELEPDDDLAPAPASQGPEAPVTPAPAPVATTSAPAAAPAVSAAQDLRRQRRSRPDFVEGKKERWRPSDLQQKTIAYSAVGIIVVALVVLLGVWGAKRGGDSGGDQTSGWTAVVELGNSSSAQSDPFELGNGQHRLEFSVEQSAQGTASQYSFLVVPSGAATADLQQFVVASGSIPGNFAGGARADAVEFIRPAGDYTLQVVSENCTWSARVLDNK